MNKVTGKNSKDVREADEHRLQYIKSKGFNHRRMKECEWRKQLAKSPELQRIVNGFDIQLPIDPRDAFLGGRVDSTNLYFESEDGGKDSFLRYSDFVSLYPYTNKWKRYPVGHPRIINGPDFPPLSEVFGLVKAAVNPPSSLLHPVLGMKVNSKLLFTLCYKCALEGSQAWCMSCSVAGRPTCRKCRNLKTVRSCSHTTEERRLTGVFTSIEVEKAVSVGYTIEKIYEIWTFDETTQYDPSTNTGGIFAEYVNM